MGSLQGGLDEAEPWQVACLRHTPCVRAVTQHTTGSSGSGSSSSSRSAVWRHGWHITPTRMPPRCLVLPHQAGGSPVLHGGSTHQGVARPHYPFLPLLDCLPDAPTPAVWVFPAAVLATLTDGQCVNFHTPSHSCSNQQHGVISSGHRACWHALRLQPDPNPPRLAPPTLSNHTPTPYAPAGHS